MSYCQHNKKITLFCISESCQINEGAGCDICIHLKHAHRQSQRIIKQDQLLTILRKLTISNHIKQNRKTAIEDLYRFLLTVRNQLTSALDNYAIEMMDQLKYPFLYHHHQVQLFKKIRNKDYRKIEPRKLRTIYNEVIRKEGDLLERQEINLYNKFMNQVVAKLNQFQSNSKQLQELLNFSFSKELWNYKETFTKNVKLFTNNLQTIRNSSQIQTGKSNNSMSSNYSQRQNHTRNISLAYLTPTKSIEFLDHSASKSDHSNQSRNSPEVISTKTNTRTKSLVEDCSSLLKSIDQSNIQIIPQLSNILTYSDPNGSLSITVKDPKQSKKQNFNTNQSLIMKKQRQSQKVSRKQKLKEMEAQRIKEKQQSILQRMKQLIDEKNKQNNPKQTKQQTIIDKQILSSTKDSRNSFLLRIHQKSRSQLSSSINKDVSMDQIEPTPQIINGTIKKRIPFENGSLKLNWKLLSSDEHSVLKQANNFLFEFNKIKEGAKDKQIISYLQGSLRRHEGNLTAAEWLTYYYVQIGMFKECLTICNKYLQIVSKQQAEILLINKSAALNHLGRYSQSIYLIESSMTNNPKLHKNLGDAYHHIGVIDKAIYHYEKATQLNSNLDEAYYNLSAILYLQGSYFNAKMNISKALQLNPNNATYRQLSTHIDSRISQNHSFY